jgi:hypothetical protein
MICVKGRASETRGSGQGRELEGKSASVNIELVSKLFKLLLSMVYYGVS